MYEIDEVEVDEGWEGEELQQAEEDGLEALQEDEEELEDSLSSSTMEDQL